ncbi:MAG: TraB domain-containing protein [archaeon]
MKIFNNIYLVGTSHVAEESMRQVDEAFHQVSPHIIALELDQGRAYALTHKVKKPSKIQLLRRLGIGGFLFYVIGEYTQKNIGKLVGVSPGSEMLRAIELAKGKSKVALIDRDLQITLRRFSKRFRKREMITMLADFIIGPFKKNEFAKMDLSKTPSEELVIKLVEYIKKKYPSIHKILIDERDNYMADNLIRLSLQNPDKNILAVVGAGHIPGIIHILASGKENFK